LPADYSISQFRNEFKSFLQDYFQISKIRSLTPTDKSEIEKLSNEKYKQWEWNYGYSPAYTFQNEVDGVSVKISVKNGIINNIEIEGELENMRVIQEKLNGTSHNLKEIKEVLTPVVQKKEKDLLIKLLGF